MAINWDKGNERKSINNANIQILDDLIDPDLIKSMHHEYAHNYYWQYGHHGSNDSPRFFVAQKNMNGSTIFNCPFQIYLKTKIEDELNCKFTYIDDIYLNGQTKGFDGGEHIDVLASKDTIDRMTVLYMVNHEHTDTIGNFYCSNKEIEFKPGRIVMFPSIFVHEGKAPTNNHLRITLAWKACDISFAETK